MGAANQRKSNRQSIRLPISNERAAAVMRIGWRSISGTMVNQSSGGFGVQVDRDSKVTNGQCLVLGTMAGWCRVRVVNVLRNDDGLYVGMQRLADLPADWHKWKTVRVWPFHRLRVPLPSLGSSHGVIGGLIVCCAVLAAVFWDAVGIQTTPRWIQRMGKAPMLSGGKFTGPSDASSSPSTSRNETTSSSSPSLVRRAEGTPLGRRGWIERELEQRGNDTGRWLRDLRSSTSTSSEDLSADLRHVGEWAQDLAEIITFSTDELPDASLLLSPEVEKKLQITPEQRAEILSIVRAGNEAAVAVYANATDRRSPLVRFQVTRVRRAASERAVAVLTAPQKKQLKALGKR